jgi:hypothetical protein
MAAVTVGWCGITFPQHGVRKGLDIVDDGELVRKAAERCRVVAAGVVAECQDLTAVQVLAVMVVKNAGAVYSRDRVALAGMLWALSQALGSTWLHIHAHRNADGGLDVRVEVLAPGVQGAPVLLFAVPQCCRRAVIDAATAARTA